MRLLAWLACLIPAMAEADRVAAGVVGYQHATYFGSGPGDGEGTKVDFRGASGFGLRVDLVHDVRRRIDVGVRTTLLAVDLPGHTNAPTALYELRTTGAAAFVIPFDRGAARIGVDLGITAGRMRDRDDARLAIGWTAGAFVGVHHWPWKWWGWFFDVEPIAYANLDGGYDVRQVWLGRTSAGVLHAW